MQGTCDFSCVKFVAGNENCQTPMEHYAVVSCVAFQMARGYRDLGRYISGLRSLSSTIARFTPGVLLRLFVDGSVDNDQWKETLEGLGKQKHVQLVYYSCPDFADDKGHDGVFGTMMRYVPMLDDPSLPAWVRVPDGMPVACQDIDFAPNVQSMASLAAIKVMGQEPSLDTIMLVPTSSMAGRHKLRVGGLPTTIWAGAFVSRAKIPGNDLKEFLESVRMEHEGRLALHSDEGRTENTMYLLEKPNTKVMDKGVDFSYGIDEFFACWVFKGNLVLGDALRQVLVMSIHNIDRVARFMLSQMAESCKLPWTDLQAIRDLCQQVPLLPDVRHKDKDAIHDELAALLESKKSRTDLFPNLNSFKMYKGRLPSATADREAFGKFLHDFLRLVVGGHVKCNYYVFQSCMDALVRHGSGLVAGPYNMQMYTLGQGAVKESPVNPDLKASFMNAMKMHGQRGGTRRLRR